jgi:hypothetical protein
MSRLLAAMLQIGDGAFSQLPQVYFQQTSKKRSSVQFATELAMHEQES